MVLFVELRHRVVRLRLDVDHAEQQQRMVCGQCPPRFADDVRHRQLVLAAGFGDRVDDVVRVLLKRVVHARLGRRAAAVVIHTQAAAHIHVGDVDTHRAQLGVVARDLLQSRLDVADVSDLRAEVKVNELEDIEAVDALQLVDQPHKLRGA